MNLFKEFPLGVYHELTEDENNKVNTVNEIESRIQHLDQLILEEKKKLESFNCTEGHIVYDKGGFPYDVRTCVICGNTSLI